MSVRRSTLAVLVSLGAGALALLPAAASAEQCPNAAFRTGPAGNLPDCRAYELISPPYKNSGLPKLIARSANGSIAGMRMSTATPEAEGFEDTHVEPEAFYSLERTASGWETRADNPPRNEYDPLGTSFGEQFNSDFLSMTQGGAETLWGERKNGQPNNSIGIFDRLSDGSIVEVGPAVPPTTAPGLPQEIGYATQLQAVGVSADGSRMVFYINTDYWPFDENKSNESLYEYAGTGNHAPLLVGVDNEGKLISKCGTGFGGAKKPFYERGRVDGESNTHNAISSPSGTTIFFTARCGVRVEDELYARIDNGEPGARTVDISEPSKEDCEACDTETPVLSHAIFEGASEDGSKVFFETPQPLLEGATGWNLYEYDFDAPAGARVTRVGGELLMENELIARPSLPSEDGSHVYFVSTGVLTATPNRVGETATAEQDNLYVYERDANYPAGRTEFVATLTQRDLRQWTHDDDNGYEGHDVTPNGDFIVFASERDLTPDTTTQQGVRQLFEYDAQTGALVRVSIGENGFNHNGNVNPAAGVEKEYMLEGQPIPPQLAPSPNYPYQYEPGEYWNSASVSADGSYVFFESIVGLTPQALDRKLVGRKYLNCSGEEGGSVCSEEGEYEPLIADNIYEYHAGQVYLISDGQDLGNTGSYTGLAPGGSTVSLLGTDESGADVFFATADRLVGQDTDTAVDIYDARIDGGFPGPAEPPSCSGESCQGPLSGAPTLLSPGSEFQAGGNPPLTGTAAAPAAKPTKCKRGYVKKRGKCEKAKQTKKAAKQTKKAGNKRRVKS